MGRRRLLGSHEEIMDENSAAEENGFASEYEYPPYTGKQDLEAATLGKKGYVKKHGAKRYLINRKGDKYKLIEIFKNGRGIARRHVVTLAPRKQGNRGMKDAAFLRRLAKDGVPGVSEGEF